MVNAFKIVNWGGALTLHTITGPVRAALLAGLWMTASAAIAEAAPEDLISRANAGDDAATSELGVWLYDRDDKAAVPWLNKAMAHGDAEATYVLGMIKRDGELGVAADWNGGMSLLQQAALMGSGNAIYELNTCCDTPQAYAPPAGGTERLRWALRMREADSENALRRIQEQFRHVILKAAPDAQLPF